MIIPFWGKMSNVKKKCSEVCSGVDASPRGTQVPNPQEKEGAYKVQVGEGRGVRQSQQRKRETQERRREEFVQLGFYFCVGRSIELVV